MADVHHRAEHEIRPAAPRTGDGVGPETAAAAGPRDAPWRGGHPVNVRLSVPLPFGRYFLTIVAGSERRNAARRASERRRHPLATFGNVVLFFVVGTTIGLSGLAVIQLAAVSFLERGGMLGPVQ